MFPVMDSADEVGFFGLRKLNVSVATFPNVNSPVDDGICVAVVGMLVVVLSKP